MTGWRVVRGRVERFAAHYHGEPFHALLCDPPYELAFMGRKWDSRGVAFDPATWAALGSLLYPGAFGMAFASARGWHRLACAIEDAGLVIHPSIFGWAFGSGFPKATRVKDAPAFTGHRYGLQALKPALEPIIVFQRPYAGRPVDSITATGAGALWIDGGRIATGDSYHYDRKGGNGGAVPWAGLDVDVPADNHPAGRWPANLYLSHAPGCNGTCVPGCPVARLGEQSGTTGPSFIAKPCESDGMQSGYGGKLAGHRGPRGHADTGTAARFFFNADWAADVAEQLAAADPVRYCAKASRKERDAGLEGMPRKFAPTMGDGIGAREHNPEAPGALVKNVHPTVKPIALARWLATLLLPPSEYAPRRVLVPFAGSGSEMIGAVLAGWETVVGIEGEREYAEIARARLRYWTGELQAGAYAP